MKQNITKPQYAGALLITPDNKVILQQRDNKPGIMNPGQITTFGGAVEDGETPQQAVERELKEELDLDYSQPKLYKIFHKTQAIHGENREMHIYVVPNVEPAKLTMHEGAGYVVTSQNENLENITLTQMAKEILTHYFK